MVVAKRVNANTFETSFTLKGKPTTVNTRVVSADGETLTVTTTGTNAQGQAVKNVQGFEKGQPHARKLLVSAARVRETLL